MWASIIPAAISGVTSLASGILGADSAKKASKKDYKRQKEFAQNSIRWRVADAEAAGLHPLAALGAQVSSYSPASVGGDPMAAALSNMGQDISRAAEAALAPQDKIAVRSAELAIENQELTNELTRAQIASVRMRNMQAGTPGLPGPGVVGKVAKAAGYDKSLPLPGTDIRLPVSHPGLGQAAEDHYSDIGGLVFGGMGMANDALKYLGLENMLSNTRREWESLKRNARGFQYRRNERNSRSGGAGW